MGASSYGGVRGYNCPFEVSWADGDRILCRTCRDNRRAVLIVLPAAERPAQTTLDQLAHEYGLKDLLESTWAARPLELIEERGTRMLVLEDPGGEPLDRLMDAPMEIGKFLQLAIALASTLDRLHERGLIHRDIKPANALVDLAGSQVWLTGFRIAIRAPHEQQSVEPPELIPGTLAYMAPEQTGRMNRSVDSRSDLYSLGVSLYQLLTGTLPFAACDPMEWVHCHIARRPQPPNERLKSVPATLSALILKLLAKTPEDRYQTAFGLEWDLRRCLRDWETLGQVGEFSLGEHDALDRLLIPERLYGRARQLQNFVDSFDRVMTTGIPELVLVSGYSGVGKSAVVNELSKLLLSRCCLFASGKFDEYTRDVPYATLAQAFKSLVRPLLGGSEAQLREWGDALHKALDPNASLILDLVPELKLVVGEQPAAPDLPIQDAQRRFHLLLERLIAVFARAGKPLALFLDDLQWLDAATLDFLEHLMGQPDVRHLLLIGAYRANEVGPAHPLIGKLEAIRRNGANIHEMVLEPLAEEDLQELIADSLRCKREHVASLAQLVYAKTGGNPFFAIQFLTTLTAERLLSFDRRAARWSWDPGRIHEKGYTDNVVDFMLAKLNRLPAETQAALQQLACIGSRAEIALIQTVADDSTEMTGKRLQEAIRTGLLARSGGSYRFVHDRAREAAYSGMPEQLRAATHLRIGRVLAAQTPVDKRDEHIFEIVHQFNQALQLITREEERKQVIELNVVAAKRAKNATAYESALNYLAAARILLTDEDWEPGYKLIFPFEYLTAECELMMARMEAAEKRLCMLAERAETAHDFAAVTRLRLTLYTVSDRSDLGVEICLQYLRRQGTQWSVHPTHDEVRREYDRIWLLLGNRQIEELVDLPPMTDLDALDTLEVLTEIVTPAVFFDQNLCSLAICRMVNLSLEHGNSDGSCFGYVWFGIVAGPNFGNYEDAFRFGQLGYELVEKRGLTRYQARTYMSFGNLVVPRLKHVREGRDLVRRAFDAAHRAGDLTFAAYSLEQIVTSLLAAGDPLSAVQAEAQNGLAFARRARFGIVVDLITAQTQLVRTLRGLTTRFGSLDDIEFHEAQFELHLASSPGLAESAFQYWSLKTQARYLAGDYGSAVRASDQAEPLIWAVPAMLELAGYRFYSALAHAAHWASAGPEERVRHYEALKARHRQLEVLAAHCPVNFADRAALVGAEITRIEGRVLEAERLYEQAIRAARASGFVHHEAIASEVAGRFYLFHGLETNAYAHLRIAAARYAAWGADAKVRQLESLYPDIGLPEPRQNAGAAAQSVQQLDLTTIVQASQAISSEIELPKLVEQLMTVTLHNAGADRGLLIITREGEYRVEVEALMSSDNLVLRHGNALDPTVPQTIVRYAMRTHEKVILGDTRRPNVFSADDYLSAAQPRSLLCLPLVRQGVLGGVLYLENRLAPHVFTPARCALLELIASQAAISLENTRLYGDLRAREAKVRRLVDANIVGIAIFSLQGWVVEANDAFLQMLGLDREDLVSRRVNWRELTPPEWHHSDEERIVELNATGRVVSHEKEFFHKRGHRVPVLVSAARFEWEQDEGVSFITDLTDRKRAERALRDSERRYHEVEIALAHANRVATMGQLSASIVHEINQPIAASVTNAQAALRWLAAESPDMEEARQALARIVKNGNRAAEVINRIRALVKKAAPRKDWLQIDEAILDVIALTRAEVTKSGVFVRTQFAQTPRVHGDRVQLQQVILNLIINAVEAMTNPALTSRDLLISSETLDSNVVVTVRDSGVGIAPENITRIFEAFYTTKASGLGMGLSICSSIIEAHGGQLRASANEPGGATFQFTLPVQVADAPAGVS